MNKENRLIEKAIRNAVRIEDKQTSIKKSEEVIDQIQKLNLTKEKAVNTLRKNNKENKDKNKIYFALTMMSLVFAAGSLIIAILSLLLR